MGTPGSIFTFFPWEGTGQGSNGAGMATGIGYSVPEDSLEFLARRFQQFNVKHGQIARRFGAEYLSFQDPDGIDLIANSKDTRIPWETGIIYKII